MNTVGRRVLKWAAVAVAFALTAGLRGQQTTNDVSVGRYLYADVTKVDDASGGLVVSFSKPSKTRIVVAYAWSTRKLRKSREGTNEETRQNLKPRLAKMTENGKVATFEKLTHDFYDLCVIDYGTMELYEGLRLHHLAEDSNQPKPETIKAFTAQIAESLGLRKDRIGGWEGFFDTKQVERIEVADEQAGVLMQQLRKGKALAESADEIKGCIHSIDVVWVQQTMGENNGWQVIQRQQLYRGELPDEGFFKHHRMPELGGIRIGAKVKKIKGF